MDQLRRDAKQTAEGGFRGWPDVTLSSFQSEVSIAGQICDKFWANCALFDKSMKFGT